MKRRRNSDRWEAILSHTDSVAGEVVRTFHTVEGKTSRQAERARDALILELENKGGSIGSSMSVKMPCAMTWWPQPSRVIGRPICATSLEFVAGQRIRAEGHAAHDAIGTAGRESRRRLFLIATAAAEPSRGRPPRRQEHLTTAGRKSTP